MSKILSFIIAISILLIALSAAYYLVIYLPKHNDEVFKQQKVAESNQLREDCLDRVISEMKVEHPQMETSEITSYRIDNDRGCFLEAGCMQGVTDPFFEAQFENCNMDYYDQCFRDVKVTVEEMIETERDQRVEKCVDLYSN